jgi:pilus assembly protein CpaE
VSIRSRFGRALHVVVLSADPEWRGELNRWLLEDEDLQVLRDTAQPEEAAAACHEGAAEVLLVDHVMPRGSGMDVAERLARRMPRVLVVLTTESSAPEVWMEARRRGISGVIRKPATDAARARWVGDLKETVLDALDAVARDQARAERAAREDGAAQGTAPAGARSGRQATLLAVWTPKGGSGKTTVAVNVALWCAWNPSGSVPTALLSLEQGTGALHAHLGVPAEPTTLAWREYAEDRIVDRSVVERLTYLHRRGLRCVFAPGAGEATPGELARTILQSLWVHHALTVVDCAPTPDLRDAAVGAALELATYVLVPMEPETPVANEVAEALALVRRAGVDLSKFRVVLNKVPEHPSMTVQEVRRALGVQVIGSIPYDRRLGLAVNRQRPPAAYDPGGPFMAALRRVIPDVTGLSELALGGPRTGLRGRLFGRRREAVL